MIFGAELVGRIAVEHELNIVVSIRNAHIDPAQLLWIRPAAPRLFESQYVAVKVYRLFTVSDQRTKVIDLGCDARVRLEFAGGLCFEPVRKSLDERQFCPGPELP
jgi:hypothetical protein